MESSSSSNFRLHNIAGFFYILFHLFQIIGEDRKFMFYSSVGVHNCHLNNKKKNRDEIKKKNSRYAQRP